VSNAQEESRAAHSDFAAQAGKIASSTAHVCLYVGLDSSDKALAIPKNNFWIYETYDFSASLERFRQDPTAALPLVYISFPSAKDPLRDQQNGGRATVQVMAAYDFEAVKKWKDRAWGQRGDEYDQIKNDLKQKLTAALIKVLPQIEGHIAYSELSTPLSTRHFMNYQSGEIYGLEHTPARFALRSLRPQTRIKGLFLTGQDVVTVGVAGALYSGVLTATTILKKSVIMRILFNLPLSRRATRA
jgi:all-trans-retinol 13,14-reductase